MPYKSKDRPGSLYKRSVSKNSTSFTKKKQSFPDLTGDGKVTQADVLKGRGVFQMSKADVISGYASSIVDAISENQPVYTQMRAQRSADRQEIRDLKGTGASRAEVRAKRRELRQARKVKRAGLANELNNSEEGTDE
jgi:type III secretory pathway component EscU